MEHEKQSTIEREQKLGNTPVPKLLFQMSAPMIFAMIVNGLYYLIDAVFVGRVVGGEALGGLAAGFPIDMLVVALGTMLGIGTASIVSFELGSQKKEEAASAIISAVLFTIALSVAFSAILMVFKADIFHIFGATERIFKYADAYYSVIIPGSVLVLLSFLGINTVRAEGNAKLAALVMFSGALINVFLNAAFMIVFNMGIAGAAWGTLLARLVSVIILMGYYGFNKSIINLWSVNWRINITEIRKILLIGLSSFLNQVGFSILAAAVNILLKNYGTAVDMSVYGVISRIHIFITMPLLGLAQGFHSIVGFNFGAGNYKRVSETVKISFIYAFAIGLFLFGFLVFMPQDILRLFTDKPEVIQNGVFALRITTLMTPVIGLQIIAYFYFMAVHKAVTAMLVSLSRQVIFILPPLIVLPLFMGKQGIWLAFPMADIVAVAVSAALLLRSVNKQVKEGSLPDRCS